MSESRPGRKVGAGRSMGVGGLHGKKVRRGKRVTGRATGGRKSPLKPVVVAPSAPAKRVTVPTLDPERTYLLPSELIAFFKALPNLTPTPKSAPFWHAYFFVEYHYGCRLSEPALITDADVIPEKLGRTGKVTPGKILIRRLKKETEDEGFKEHVYDLDPRVQEHVTAVQQWKATKYARDSEYANPYLFPSTRRRTNEQVGAERLSQLRNESGWQAVSRFTAHRVFQRIAVEIRLPERLRYSPVIRHTRSVIMLASGASVAQVQYAMAHSVKRVTERYRSAAEYVATRLAISSSSGLTGNGTVGGELIAMGLGL